MRINTVSLYTLGCRLNQCETAILTKSLETEGFEVVDFKNPADVVVINTCTVTDKGDTDTRRLINRINRKNSKSNIALIGCQAQTQKEKLKNFKNVKWIIGNERKMDLSTILKETKDSKSPHIITPDIKEKSGFTMPYAGTYKKHTRANLKVQDGCNFFCSYCEVPYARGRARSRKFDNILKEARTLVTQGHKEIVVTGINVGLYKNEGHNITDVIEKISEVRKLKRIRLSSIEPTTISKSLIEMMSKNQKLCRYLHIPLQSGSDAVLKRMNRRYSAKAFADFINFAHNSIPDICIGTDIMVGFPGETEKDFLKTFEFLKSLPINYFHVFSYSRRNLAKSKDFKNEINPKTVRKRSEALRNLSMNKRKSFYESLLDKKMSVLFEQKKNGCWSGLTDNFARIKVSSKEDLSNKLIKVKLKKTDGLSIAGTLVR